MDRILRFTLLLLTAGLIYVTVDSLEQKIITVGDSAPNFSITSDDGRTYTASDFGGRLLVLNFWATWCPPCIEEIPSLDMFQQRMKDKGVVVLAISVDKNPQIYKRFLERTRPAFTTARDSEADISASYGTFKYPETYLIDTKGKVVEKYINSRNWMDPKLIAEIERHL
jgi:peroxiredoxin